MRLLGCCVFLTLAAAVSAFSPFGAPISDWYFVIRSSPGWIPLKQAPYCGFSSTPTQAVSSITCDARSAPLFSLFTLVSPSGQLPALTGQDLLLVSHTTGLCFTRQPTSRQHITQHQQPPAQRLRGVRDDAFIINTDDVTRPDDRNADRAAVACRSSFEQAPSMFRLLGPDLAAGTAIDIRAGGQYYLLEGDKFCGVADTDEAKSSLVCDFNTTSGAMKFMLLPAAMPSASLSSLSSLAACGIKSLLLPPPHDLACASNRAQTWAERATETIRASVSATMQELAALLGRVGCGDNRAQVRERQLLALGVTGTQPLGTAASDSARALRRSSRWMPSLVPAMDGGAGASPRALQDDRTYTFTLLLQKPGSVLASGSTVAIVTYSPGLVGFPLQQCCAQGESPHVVECGVAGGDPLPAECWFNLYKVSSKSGEPIQDGDLIMIQSKAFSRYCSVTLDGTMLCVSATYSNATRNLFTYQQASRDPGHLGHPHTPALA